MNALRPGWGWFCIALGLYPLLIAFGVIRVQETDVHAPIWVVALCGLVFVVAGCMILLARQARLNNLFGGVICLSFGAVGVWVSLFSPPEGFSGGIPLLSSETNVKIARWMFGGGAVLCFAMTGHAVRLALRRSA